MTKTRLLRAARAIAASILILLGAAQVRAAAIGPAPTVNARSAVLIDAATGTLLYAKNPDLALPPASLTKLVTLHLAYEEIAAGRLSPDELVEIAKEDASPYIPYGSSIMYLRAGMKVSVRDLMLGAAVVSGNDAAYSLARRIAGSNETFAERMNESVRAMGFSRMVFVEPSGLSELNLVTAREFALFAKRYLEIHPRAIAELHSVKSIAFPRAEHAVPGYVPAPRTVQYNRNPLIFGYEGADGLKTGYIIEVGFNMTATAKRDGTRFIAVTLGGSGTTYSGGGAQRSRDTTALLDWAFGNFVTVSPDYGDLPAPRVWFGKKNRVTLIPAGPAAVTLPKDDAASAEVRIEAPASVDGPLRAGAKVGQLVYSAGGRELHRVDLVAAEAVESGGFLKRAFDGVGRFFFRLFSKSRT